MVVVVVVVVVAVVEHDYTRQTSTHTAPPLVIESTQLKPPSRARTHTDYVDSTQATQPHTHTRLSSLSQYNTHTHMHTHTHLRTHTHRYQGLVPSLAGIMPYVGIDFMV